MPTAADAMTTSVVVLEAGTPVRLALDGLRSRGVRYAAVERDVRGRFGFVDAEQLAAIDHTQDGGGLDVGAVCRRLAVAVPSAAPLGGVIRLMAACDVDRVAVVDGPRLAGLLTQRQALIGIACGADGAAAGPRLVLLR